MSDEGDLLKRAAEGDSEAWRAVLERHGPFALGLARDRLRRAGAAGAHPEDLVQEVWVALLVGGGRALRRIDPALGLRSYLAASVLHAVHRHLRGASRRRTREEGHRIPPSPELPDEPLLRSERSGEVEAALVALEPRDRLFLRWIYWDGLSYATVARMSGVQEGSVGPLLARSREQLREALERKKGVRGPGTTG